MSARSVTRSKAGTDYIDKYLKTHIHNGNLHIVNSTGDALYHIQGSEIIDSVNVILPILSGDDTIAFQNTNNNFGGVQTFNQGVVTQGGLLVLPDPNGVLEDDIIITDGLNLVLGSSQGTTIGMSPTQMLGFFGVTPTVQPAAGNSAFAGTVSPNINDLWDVVVGLGLMSSTVMSTGFQDMTETPTPSNPPLGTRRLYVDSTTHAISSLDSVGVSHNIEANPFADIEETVKPTSPAVGTRRIYVDSTTHAYSSLDSVGTSHNLESVVASKATGVFTDSGNGSNKTFNIPHGLGVIPSGFLVTAGSGNANGDNSQTADVTNVIVLFNSAPSSGTNNVVLNWVAFV
jgi:hypothetical protein